MAAVGAGADGFAVADSDGDGVGAKGVGPMWNAMIAAAHTIDAPPSPSDHKRGRDHRDA